MYGALNDLDIGLHTFLRTLVMLDIFPQAYAPELYLLEASADTRAQLVASSSENSTRPQTRTSINQNDDSPRNSYIRDTYQYNKNRESEYSFFAGYLELNSTFTDFKKFAEFCQCLEYQ